MKISSKLLILLTLIAMLVGCFAACGPTETPPDEPGTGDNGGGEEELQFVD